MGNTPAMIDEAWTFAMLQPYLEKPTSNLALYVIMDQPATEMSAVEGPSSSESSQSSIDQNEGRVKSEDATFGV